MISLLLQKSTVCWLCVCVCCVWQVIFGFESMCVLNTFYNSISSLLYMYLTANALQENYFSFVYTSNNA